MVLATGPDWLGSPQHFVGGLVLTLVVIVLTTRLLALRPWVSFALAIGVTSFVEIVVELVEYPTKHSGHLHSTAYYDTLADMANTVAGAFVAVAVAITIEWWRGRRAAGV